MNRRTLNRHRCRVTAHLCVLGEPELECDVRDLTLKGARLTLPAEIALPQRLTVVLPGWGDVRAAQLRWQEGNVIGVAFGPDEKTSGAQTLYPDIFALQVQVAELARTLSAHEQMRGTRRRVQK
ncbi:MAG: PilZ domain-containing protein [Methylovirgula sp.]